MDRPFSPDYKMVGGGQITLAAGVPQSFDLGNGSGLTTGKSLRIYNSGANPLEFAAYSDSAVTFPASHGVVLKATDSIIVFIDHNTRYLKVRSAAGTTFYANLGQGGV